MSKAIAIGLMVSAALAPGFTTVFKTAREQAQGLKTALSNSRLGATAAADVARLGARLDRLKASQGALGSDNVKLANRITQTQQALSKARAAASQYGVTLDNASAKHKAFAASADKATQSLHRLQAAQRRKAVRDEARGELLGVAGAAAAFVAPVKVSMDEEHRLRAIGNIANLSAQQVEELGQSMRRVGADTNQTSDAMLDAYNVLLGKGLDSGRATAVLAPIGKTATAAQASVEDLSVTTYALLDNLKLAESQVPKAMDMLAQAGKEGSFELKDMAKFFPQLTAQAATLGMQGTEAVATLGSALQVAMKGAGSPEEAANNLKNFLQKMTSPDTVKNFKEEFGVNLETSMKEAMARGENPVEYMVALIGKLTKGDKFRIGELFGDMQVGNFLAPMLQNMEEYRQIKERTLGASGVVDQDFANMMGTGTERIKIATISLTRLGSTLGSVLLPTVGAAAESLGAMVSVVADLAQRYPNLTTVIAFTAAGLVAFKVAAMAGRIGGTLLMDGVSLVTGAFRTLRPSVIAANASMLWSRTVAIASAVAHGVWQGALLVGRGVMLGWAAVTTAVTAAQWLWNAALTANPIGLVITAVAALAGAAYLIYENWEPIKTWFADLWDSIAAACGAAMQEITSLVTSPLGYLEDTLGAVTGWLGFGGKESASGATAAEGLGQTVPEPASPTPTAPPASGVTPTTLSGLTAEKAQALASDPKWQSPRHQAILQRAMAGQGGQAEQTPPAKSLPVRGSQAEASPPAGSAPAKGGGAGSGLVVNNTVTVTGVGLEHVQQVVKTALDAFSRDLESRLEAMRSQQMRVAYGG